MQGTPKQHNVLRFVVCEIFQFDLQVDLMLMLVSSLAVILPSAAQQAQHSSWLGLHAPASCLHPSSAELPASAGPDPQPTAPPNSKNFP